MCFLICLFFQGCSLNGLFRSPFSKNIASITGRYSVRQPVVSLAAILALDAGCRRYGSLGQAVTVCVVNIATPNNSQGAVTTIIQRIQRWSNRA